MITRVAVIPYAVPFRRPIATAHETFHVRRGWWLLLGDEEGVVGTGEVAPLASFGTETHEEAGARITRFLEEKDGDDLRVEFDTNRFPAFTAGLALALEDHQARSVGQRLVDRFTSDAHDSIACHRLLRETLPDALAAEAAGAAADGYEAVKLKIGQVAIPADLSRVAAVREAVGGGVRIRLDANGAYDEDTALDLLRRLEPYAPEFVEQPVAEGIGLLRGRTGVAVAADEEAAPQGNADRIIRERAADVVVLKPACIGGIRAAAMLAERARENGIGVVVTGALETPVGIAGALHLAGSFPLETVCGLATADLLEETPLRGLTAPAGGRIRLPTGSGHGVALDPKVAEGRWR